MLMNKDKFESSPCHVDFPPLMIIPMFPAGQITISKSQHQAIQNVKISMNKAT